MKGRRGRIGGHRPRVGELPVEEDVERELEAHVAMRAEELVDEGWPEAEAWEEARRLFGDFDGVRRACEREVRSADRAVKWTMGREAVMQDVRHAVRSLVRSPGFAAVAILTLALGIGANSAIFSVLHGVLLSPLDYRHADRLVWVAEAHDGPGAGPGPVPWPNFRDWKASARSFEALTSFGAWSVSVVGGDAPVRAPAAAVSVDFWSVFEPDVRLGRFTAPGEHVPGTGASVVVSERFWRTHLGADPEAVGRTLEVGGAPAVVVGVLEAGFHFPGDTDVWGPLEIEDQSGSRTAHNWRVVGLLAPGVEPAAADAELDRISGEMVAGLPADDYDITGAIVTPLKEEIAGDSSRALHLLMGAAALLLLVACTNLASTLLARGVGRGREMAVRASLGAGRGRLVRQLLAEAAVLSVAGAGVGLLLAAGLLDVIRRLAAGSIPRIETVGLHPAVLGFTLGVAVLTTLLCGLVPALRASRSHPGEALREGARGNAGVRHGMWRLLVGAEVALALALLVGGGLLVRSFAEVLEVDPGFSGQGVMSAEMSLSSQRYPTLPGYAAFHRTLVDALETRPEVERAAVATSAPLGRFLATGSLPVDYDAENWVATGAYLAVSPGYFDVLDIDVVRGRGFTEADDASAPWVALVSESFARATWPGEDPIGRVITGGGMDNYWNDPTWSRVVGVVEDVKYESLTGAPAAAFYFPVQQRPYRTRNGFVALARARSGDPGDAAPAVREVVERLDPTVPVVLQSMEERVRQSLADRRLVLFVLGGFAVVALLLAGLGIYGVVAYLVASRTREMGIRLALGETPGSVRRSVVGGALAMVAGGLVVGSGAAFLGSRLVRSFLYGVEPTDPATMATVVVLLLATGVTAAWLPARRATRVDPVRTMRSE